MSIIRRVAESAVHSAWAGIVDLGTIRHGTWRARRFGHFGVESAMVFPYLALYGEQGIWVGHYTMIGPNCSLSAGMLPGQQLLADPVIRLGDGVMLGRGSSVVGHFRIEIDDGVCTGPNVYITDQNHAYEDLTTPIQYQTMTERPVFIGAGSWLGTNVVVLPGARIGKHVTVAAGSVVTGELPDYCVAAGNPARVVREHVPEVGWMRPAGA